MLHIIIEGTVHSPSQMHMCIAACDCVCVHVCSVLVVGC